MIKGLEAILIGSENATILAKFYREVVGLKQTMSFELGEKGESGYDFDLKGASIYILDHSEIKGKNKQPPRVMFNLEVDDMDKEVARMKKEKVKVVQDTYHVQDYGLITTFEDPDGNYFQFVQVRQLN